MTTKISDGVSITSYSRMMWGCVQIFRMLISRRTFSPISSCLILFRFKILIATCRFTSGRRYDARIARLQKLTPLGTEQPNAHPEGSGSTYPVPCDDMLPQLDLSEGPDTQRLPEAVVPHLQRIIDHCASENDTDEVPLRLRRVRCSFTPPRCDSPMTHRA